MNNGCLLYGTVCFALNLKDLDVNANLFYMLAK